MSLTGKKLSEEDIATEIESTRQALNPQLCIEQPAASQQDTDTPLTDGERGHQGGKGPRPRSTSPELVPQDLDVMQPVAECRIGDMVAYMAKLGARFEKNFGRRDDTIFALSHVVPEGLYAVLQIEDPQTLTDETVWVVRCVRAVGFVNAMSGERMEMAFEVGSKPIPVADLGGRPPTVSPKEGNFVIDYSRVFLALQGAQAKLDDVAPAKKKPKTEEQQ
jgi:hypothetical protein